MKITDVKSAKIGEHIVIRIVTDKDGIDGFSQIECGFNEASSKDYVRPLIPYFRGMILGCDPTNVEDVMRRIRRAGAFKPWGKVASSIEMALWDIAGKEAGLPVYKLLGGKVRDKVRVYNGSFKDPNPPHKVADTPEKLGENILHLNEIPEGFSFVKLPVCWHVPYFYQPQDALNTYDVEASPTANIQRGSLLTPEGMKKTIDYFDRLMAVVGSRVGVALDCGPGFTPTDIITFARAMERHNLMWLEDSFTGDYTPYTQWQAYRDITTATTTRIHTGEQIYLRQNFIDLIENRAVDVIGPDPADVGGIAELKWIAEYADLHGILMAPHGVFDGVFGLAAHMHAAATMPQNFVGFELPAGNHDFWYDIVDGLPNDLVRDSHVPVWDNPGIGITFNVNKASKYLNAEDKDFFA